jgi:hypothetical protein
MFEWLAEILLAAWRVLEAIGYLLQLLRGQLG